MPKKLHIDSLKAQLSNVEQLEIRAREVDDPVGVAQLEAQRIMLQSELDSLGDLRETTASLAVFFGGNPVHGSLGVEADFAGQVLENLQNLISKEFAARQTGLLGARGPVPERNSSGLMITEVSRGSFGFVLEESAANDDLIGSALIDVVDDVAQIINGLTSSDTARFEEAISDLEPRVLLAARQLFKTLDEAKATVRLVEQNFDQSFGLLEIRRARERTEQMEINERDDVELNGLLSGLLPNHRRFEFKRSDTGEEIYGLVAREAAKRIGDLVQQGLDAPVGRKWRARFKVREVRSRTGSKTLYTLLGLLEALPGVPPQR